MHPVGTFIYLMLVIPKFYIVSLFIDILTFKLYFPSFSCRWVHSLLCNTNNIFLAYLFFVPVSIDNIKVSLNDSLLAEQYKAWQTKKESIEIKRNVTNSMRESMKRFVSMKYQMLHRR